MKLIRFLGFVYSLVVYIQRMNDDTPRNERTKRGNEEMTLSETVTSEPVARLLDHSVLHFTTSVLVDDTTDEEETEEETDNTLSNHDTDTEEDRELDEVVEQFRNLRNLLLSSMEKMSPYPSRAHVRPIVRRPPVWKLQSDF
jgi:hypothetical protein